MQRVVQSEPVGNMLLTQPRPLHSSICTAVLSLSSPPHHPPASLSAPPYTHGGGGRGGAHASTHLPSYHSFTVTHPKHGRSKSRIQVTQTETMSYAYSCRKAVFSFSQLHKLQSSLM